MNNITIYHNPRCSKSRQALQLLHNHHLAPLAIEYLKTPMNAEAITQLLSYLQLPARAILRTQEAVYQTLNLDNEKLSEQQLINAMVAHPILIERPIVIINNRAVIARPAEKILELL